MKRFLSLLLAAMLAFGAFALAACDSGGTKDQTTDVEGGTQPEDPPKQDTDDKQGDEQGDDNNDDNNEDAEEDDAAVQKALVERVLSTVMERGKLGMTFRNVDCRAAEKAVAGDFNVDTYFRYADGELLADAFLEQTKGGDGFALGFLRGDSVYYGTDTWQNAGVAAGKFDELLAAYKKEGGPSLTLSAPEEGAITVPVSLAVKLAMNVPELTGGMKLNRTEDGFELTYDPVEALSRIIDELIILSRGVVKPQMTLDDLLANKYMDFALSTLSRGITAREVTTLPFLADYKSMFPAAGDKEFYPYFKEIIASESYYAELPIKGCFEGVTRLGALTLENVLSLTPLTDGEDGEKLEGEALTAKVEALVREFGGLLNAVNIDPVGALLDKIYERKTGEVLNCTGEVKMTLSLHFDSDKNFTDLTLDVTEFDEVSKDGSVTFSGQASLQLTFDDTYAFADLSDVNIALRSGSE